MTLRDMDYILEVAQTQNFTLAAENLFTAQPTLSYHIRSVEEELGFTIFNRSGRGATLTPAGAQFCVTLRNVRAELKAAIEQAQNFSSRYSQALTIGLSCRSALLRLPGIIQEFAGLHPDISVTPVFSWEHSVEQFLRGDTDILFALVDQVRQIPDIRTHPLYNSPILLISLPDDPLASKELVTMKDLEGRTLMVGGGSPPALRALQQRIIRSVSLNYFNSADHETTLTQVAAHRGICLAPAFLNDGNPDFAWTPFDCAESIPCVLCTHRDDSRSSVQELVARIQAAYPDRTPLPFQNGR